MGNVEINYVGIVKSRSNLVGILFHAIADHAVAVIHCTAPGQRDLARNTGINYLGQHHHLLVFGLQPLILYSKYCIEGP